jgi:hypothetical protein
MAMADWWQVVCLWLAAFFPRILCSSCEEEWASGHTTQQINHLRHSFQRGDVMSGVVISISNLLFSPIFFSRFGPQNVLFTCCLRTGNDYLMTIAQYSGPVGMFTDAAKTI